MWRINNGDKTQVRKRENTPREERFAFFGRVIGTHASC